MDCTQFHVVPDRDRWKIERDSSTTARPRRPNRGTRPRTPMTVPAAPGDCASNVWIQACACLFLLFHRRPTGGVRLFAWVDVGRGRHPPAGGPIHP